MDVIQQYIAAAKTTSLLIVKPKESTSGLHNYLTQKFNVIDPTILSADQINTQLDKRFDLCIAINEDQNISAWTNTLGLLKNLYSEKIIFLHPVQSGESDTKTRDIKALRALGFFEEEDLTFGDTIYACASYNLTKYNRKRSWNNAKFWANPENFTQYRW